MSNDPEQNSVFKIVLKLDIRICLAFGIWSLGGITPLWQRGAREDFYKNISEQL